LEKINLAHNPIKFICKHAFEFSTNSEKRLYIHLNDAGLNENSLDVRVFTNLERPLIIDIRNNDFTTLVERIFGPILMSNTQNRLIIDGYIFQCDCRMQWLFARKNIYENQFVGEMGCAEGKPFWSMTENDFKNCLA
jgi:hypothetical protein